MVPQASSPLPYAPQGFSQQHCRGVGHPALLPLFCRLSTVASQASLAHTMVYKRHPNLVQEVHVPATWRLPWSRLVAKHFGWRGRQHFWFSPLKQSKAMKAYRTACHLLAHGLLTPLPLGAFETRRWGFIASNVYVTEALTGYLTLRKYCRTLPDGPQGLEEVLQLVAGYTRRMHDSGLWHRDLTLGNFLVAGTPGQRRLYLVDLNRARQLSYVPAWLRALDLARMDWPAWQPQFLALYCNDRFAVQRMQRIIHGYKHWRAWRQWVRRGITPWCTWLGLK